LRSISIAIIVAGLMSGVPIGIVYLSIRRSGVRGLSSEMSASTAPTAWL
jgi:hypothetical protein